MENSILAKRIFSKKHMRKLNNYTPYCHVFKINIVKNQLDGRVNLTWRNYEKRSQNSTSI